MEVELPKIYSVYEVCAKFLPQAVGTIKNRARIQADGSYLARLGGGQSLRLVKIGARFAVAENDLRQFLEQAGVRIDATPTPQPAPATQPRRRGRPRKAVAGAGGAK